MLFLFFTLVSLASAADPEGETSRGPALRWLDQNADWVKPKHLLLACYILYKLYSTFGGGGASPEDIAFSKNFLENNKTKAGVITLPSGLQYKVLRAGKGDSHPLASTPCSCHYLELSH